MRQLILVAALILALPGPAQAGFNTANAVSSNSIAGEVIHLAQSSSTGAGLAVIDAPKRIDTDTETVDFTGRATAPGEVTLTVNGQPVPVAGDGSFRIRRQVVVGRSKLLLVVEGSYGDRTEHRVIVRRTAAVVESLDYGAYHALVIGNNDYQTLSDLKMATGDAEAMAQLLAERYGFQVELLLDATRSDIISAMARKREQLTEKDNLLIYYAGHGILDVDSGEGYWLPVDAESNNPVNWISLNAITAQLRAMRTKHVMVIADSCYSGILTRSAEANLKTGAERTAWLARMNARRSRTALTSGGLEPVLDAGGGEHSVFAKALLETLGTNTEVLDGQSLFDAIKRPVVVNADQTPEYADVRKAGHDGGDFLFVPVAVVAPVVAETPAPAVAGTPAPVSKQAIELAYWQAMQGSTDPEMFEAYLEQYPNGTFARLAALKRDSLRASPEAELQVATVVPPPEPVIEVVEMDATFVALKTSNVRGEPTADGERVGRLLRDFSVAVTGKVKDANWYRIQYENREAFVFGDLIAEVDPAELAAWQDIAESDDADVLAAFIEDHPDGRFTKRAEAMLGRIPKDAGTERAEIAFWGSIKDSTNPETFRAYLSIYPNGLFADLARLREGSLTQVATRGLQPQTKLSVSTKRSGRIINIQPIRDLQGREQPILVDILRNTLQALPNAVVISELPSDQDDVVVSGSILKFEQRQETNPEYQGAQIAAQLFGGLVGVLGVGALGVANISPMHTFIDVEVLIVAQDNSTGRSYSESGYANLKIDSNQMRPNQAGFDALKTAVTQAAKRIVIRMTGGTPSRQITEEDIKYASVGSKNEQPEAFTGAPQALIAIGTRPDGVWSGQITFAKTEKHREGSRGYSDMSECELELEVQNSNFEQWFRCASIEFKILGEVSQTGVLKNAKIWAGAGAIYPLIGTIRSSEGLKKPGQDWRVSIQLEKLQ